MSDEPTPPSLPALDVLMPTLVHRKPPRRNAKPKPKPRHAARLRNAGAAPRSAQLKKELHDESTTAERLLRIGTTVVGAGVASVAGAVAVKYGFHPDLVSIGLGAVGLYSATRQRELYRDAGLGAVSAAGSQLLLMRLNPPPAPKPAEPPAAAANPAPAKPASAPQPAQHMNADLGSLPPGMLDAAFERARAELAVSSDGYPAGYETAPHHYRHGPVYPSS